MDRRGFLKGTGTATIGVIAGCAESDKTRESDSIQDTDEDGVPDEHDYAPRDPDVQSRSDVVTETRTPTSTPTPVIETPTDTPISTQQPEPTSAPSSQTNTIRADNEALKGYANHPIEYSAEHATVRLYADLIDNTYSNGADLIAVVGEYPGSTRDPNILSYHRSDSFSPPRNGDTTKTVQFNDRVSADNPIYFWFALLPADKEFASVEAEEVDFLCETDRLREHSGSLSRARHPSEPGSESTSRYSRESAEGCYVFEFSGTSYSRSWSANFTVYKHGYIEDINGEKYNDRRRYVYEALNSGLADELGHILNDEAEANGITGDREKVDFLIDFVQNLPYIPDDVSKGYDDYTKRHIETIVEGGGDCEDSAIMLASLLSSEPFQYGTALLLLPGHAALGVKGSDDIEGTYYERDGNRYYYIETTGRGWEVGEIPDEYRNEQAYVRVL